MSSVLAAALWVGGATGIALGAGAAGAAAGGGGGHAAGGGGASAGGGGAHASGSGTAVSGHSAPAGGSTATPAQGGNGGTVVHPAVGAAANGSGTTESPQNRSGPPIVHTPGTVGPANQTGSTGTSSRNGARNPYAPHGGDRNNASNRNYGVVYGYPFYPFSYGWNSGWYGNNYGSGYNNYPNNGYTFSNDSGDNGNYTQSTDNVQQQQVVPTTPAVTGPSSVTSQAVIANAVDKSPALIAANGTVNQAQTAYNDARTRVLANLRQQTAFQEAMARRHAAAGDLRTAKADGGTRAPTAPPSDAVVAAATAKLEAGDEVTKMEEQAVASDPAASAAKARLEQATADRDLLKAQLTAQTQQSAH